MGDLGSTGKRAAKTATVFYYLLIHLQRSFGRSKPRKKQKHHHKDKRVHSEK